MTRSNILVLLVLLVPGCLVAQTNFLPGYYVTLQNDTVSGYVEFRSDSRSSRVVHYKKDLQSPPVRFRPTEIKAYSIDSDHYFEAHSAPEREGETHGFFKRIIKGKLSLYQLDEHRYFVKGKSGIMQEITKGQIRTNNLLKTNYGGVSVLKLEMTDCPEMQSGYIEESYRNVPNYVKLIKKYYECTGDSYTEARQIKIPWGLDFGIQASVMQTTLNFEKAGFLKASDFGNTINYSGGLILSAFVPSFSDNVRIIAEPSYGYYSSYSYFESTQGTNDVFMRYSYMKVPLIIRYGYKTLFIDVGWTNQFVVKQDNVWRLESGINTVSTVNGPDYKIRNQLLGYTGGIGVRTNIGGAQCSIAARYQGLNPLGFTSQPKNQTLELNVGVVIGRN
jgi:hypothetical protein